MPCSPHGSEWVVVKNPRAARFDIAADEVGRALDGPSRDAGRLACFHDGVTVLAGGPRVDKRVERVRVREAPGVRRETRVTGERGLAHDRAEHPELGVATNGDRDPLIVTGRGIRRA